MFLLPFIAALVLQLPHPYLIVAVEQAQARVVILDAETDWSLPQAVVWSWAAGADPAVNPAHVAWFNHPTDAKGYDDGRRMLVSASGGGVALIDVPSRSAIFYVHVGGNTHSIDLLPDGSIVSASSTGDSITLIRRTDDAVQDPAHPDRVDYPLSDAHGLHWDDARKLLWALGGKQMKAYALGKDDAGRPILAELETIDLPDTPQSRRYPRHGGHDLSPVPGRDELFVTDMDHLWVFDCETRAFRPFEPLHEARSVKSIDQARADGPVLLMQATESWWSDTVIQLQPDGRRTLPGGRFYKARWWDFPLGE